MVFQHFSLFETLTVAENISLVVPGTKAQLAARVRETVGVVDAEAVHDAPVMQVQQLGVRRLEDVLLLHADADEAVDLFTVRRTIEQLTVKRCAQRFRRTPNDPEVLAFAERIDELVTAGCGALDQPAVQFAIAAH